jgi:hypothetical protein
MVPDTPPEKVLEILEWYPREAGNVLCGLAGEVTEKTSEDGHGVATLLLTLERRPIAFQEVGDPPGEPRDVTRNARIGRRVNNLSSVSVRHDIIDHCPRMECAELLDRWVE